MDHDLVPGPEAVDDGKLPEKPVPPPKLTPEIEAVIERMYAALEAERDKHRISKHD